LLQETNKEDALIDRLLRYVEMDVDYAVRSLSACRVFDRGLFVHLGQALNFLATNAQFEVLIRFSFVWRIENSAQQSGYRVHDLLRKVLYQRRDPLHMMAHEALEAYYVQLGEQGDPNAGTEAIYHANRLDWRRGVNKWIATIEDTLFSGQFETCRTLLEIRSALIVAGNHEESTMLRLEGDFLRRIGRHIEANEKFQQAREYSIRAINDDPNSALSWLNKAETLIRLGDHEFNLTDFNESRENYTEAIVAAEQALALNPNWDKALKAKGYAHQALGLLEVRLSEFEQAATSYTKSIAAYDAALQVSPTYTPARHNKGITLQHLAVLHADFSEYEEALACFADALANLKQVLAERPDRVLTQIVIGDIYRRLGNLHRKMNNPEDALSSYELALKFYDTVLSKEPDYVMAYNNKSSALIGCGAVQSDLYRPLWRCAG
jgi:tetratricopeptide (TPR) repeat protein